MSKNNTKIIQHKEVRTVEDVEGNITSTIVEKSSKIQRSEEPDYIKLYTKVWCEFNEIPIRLRDMFLELAVRMNYADSTNPETSQTVYAGKPVSTTIMKNLNIKQATYNQYLRELIECRAIRRVNRGVYQINPNYAGRGQWKYNPNLESGGIEDLVATFNFKDKTVETKIIWADDQTNNELNKNYREGLGNNATLKTTNIKNNQQEQQLEGQLSVIEQEPQTRQGLQNNYVPF